MHTRSLLLILATLTFATAAAAIERGPLPSDNKPDMGKGAAEAAAKAADAQPKTEPKAKEKEQPKDNRSDTQKASDIARVEAYLTSINSVVANFRQTSADGSSGTGKFYMKRPGKMRWQYNPPTPLLLVSDGKTITYYDSGLEQVSFVGVDDTLAGFLAKKEIKLDSESTFLKRFDAVDGIIRATIIQRNKPADGSLTLELTDKPLEIKNIISTDATGNTTTVKLENAQFGPVLDDKMFVFVDPRSVNRKRNKK
ncbi:MAG: LolA family protein [Rickettsiales bacterium]